MGERARGAGYKFGYYVLGPLLFVLLVGGLVVAVIAEWVNQ